MPVIKTWSEIIGHASMVLIVTIYIAFAFEFIGNALYVGLGMLTSAMMAFHAWERRTRPVMLLNGLWFIISLVGLIRAFR